ncbi:serine/threonine protein kinase [Reticulomyxa filosa]|uniref:Serine/threonine protein kinase n=1 Tax=Reticulomyxa filosa TaxID=46433 RepID=X6LYE0_RETFI|nr:serine/threonine protein kinase [Reticulomyxa filosa]|eukprot:ETO05750.1 serine/threonine protein kinase [Reticulomyxa filosa]
MNTNNGDTANVYLFQLMNGDSSSVPMTANTSRMDSRRASIFGGEQSPSNATGSNKVNKHVHTLHYHIDSVLCLDSCYVYRHVDEANTTTTTPSLLPSSTTEKDTDSKSVAGNIERKRYIFTGSQDCKIGVWDISTFQLIGTLVGHSRSVLKLRTLPRRQLCRKRGGIYIHVYVYVYVYTHVCTPDILYMFCVSIYLFIFILFLFYFYFYLLVCLFVYCTFAYTCMCVCVCVFVYGPLLFSSGRDNCICVWDVNSLSLIIRFSGFNSCVYDITVLTFPKQGGYLLYGGCQDSSIFELELEKTITTVSSSSTEKQVGAEEDETLQKNQEKLEYLQAQQSLLSFHHHQQQQQQSWNVASSAKISSFSPLPSQSEILSSARREPGYDINIKQPSSSSHQSFDSFSTSITTAKALEQFAGSNPKVQIKKKKNEMFQKKKNFYMYLVQFQFLSKAVSSLDQKVFRKYERCHAGVVYVLKAWRSNNLISASGDASIKIWEVKPRQELVCLATLEGHTHSIVALDLVGQGHLISASKDKLLKQNKKRLLKAWDISVLATNRAAWTMSGHLKEITAMKAIASGKLLVSGSRDGMVRFWDTHNYECVYSVMIPQKREPTGHVLFFLFILFFFFFFLSFEYTCTYTN